MGDCSPNENGRTMERQAVLQDQDPHEVRLLLVLLETSPLHLSSKRCEQVPQPGRDDGLFSAHNFSKFIS